MAHQPDTPNDATSRTPARNAWTVGVLLRTGEIGAMLPLSVTLRAWCTSATSTRSPRLRIAELEATVARHVDEHARTAERLTTLEQECAAALHDAKAARQVAAEDGEARARLENDVRASREYLAAMQDRLATAEAQLASSAEAADRDRRAAEQAHDEREAQWREERARLEVACHRIQERCSDLETALARHQEEVVGLRQREATLRDEVDAARIRADDDPEQMLANAELDRLRTSLAEAETALQATQGELLRATEQVAVLSKTQDEITADRTRLVAALATTRAELASSSEAARRESEAAEKRRVEHEARWREERAALAAACREARERSSELETALTRQREEMAADKQREAALRASLDAAPEPPHDEPEGACPETDLGRARASLAEAETALQATRSELTKATDQIASLSTTHDQALAEGRRLAADLAIAEERVSELQRCLDQLTDSPTSPERPIPF